MDLEQTRELLNAASAVYPNTYRTMDEQTKLRLLDEATATLSEFDYDDCTEAWHRYKAEYRYSELNLAYFVGLVKDVRDRRLREKPQLEQGEIVHDEKWHEARNHCMRKAQEVFGWSEEKFQEITGGKA